jgi:hypothetical protein
MTLFYASLSIVCAAVVALIVGAYGGFRFAYWMLQRSFNVLMEDNAQRTPMAVAWAYAQIQSLVDEGATVDQIRDFLRMEAERIEELAGDFGEDVLGPKLAAELEQKLFRPDKDDKP